jgi:hypothetical protein
MIRHPLGDQLGRFNVGGTSCPTCGTQLSDGGKVAGRRHPGVQDVSICRGCAEILVLTRSAQGLTLRPTSASEYLALPEDAQSLLRVAYLLVRRHQRVLRAPRQVH